MNNGINVSFSCAITPVPGCKWTSLEAVKRIDNIKKSIQIFLYNSKIELDYDVVEASKKGQISISINDALTAADRGTLLLDMEEFLKLDVDKSITVWHVPIGDKSSLRNLRGIEVLS